MPNVVFLHEKNLAQLLNMSDCEEDWDSEISGTVPSQPAQNAVIPQQNYGGESCENFNASKSFGRGRASHTHDSWRYNNNDASTNSSDFPSNGYRGRNEENDRAGNAWGRPAGGFSSRAEKSGGSNPREERFGGFNPREERSGGFNPQEERSGGFNRREERSGGFNSREERSGGFNSRVERSGGFNPQEERSGGSGGFGVGQNSHGDSSGFGGMRSGGDSTRINVSSQHVGRIIGKE